MPQLHFSLDADTAERLEQEAASKGLSLSKYLASIVRHAVPDQWPEGYVERVVGSCAQHPLSEPPDDPPDDVTL